MGKIWEQWERESRLRRKQEFEGVAQPPLCRRISPSSRVDLPFCNWAQRPLQAQVENAQLCLATLESTLQPQPATSSLSHICTKRTFRPRRRNPAKEARCYTLLKDNGNLAMWARLYSRCSILPVLMQKLQTKRDIPFLVGREIV